MTKENKKIKLDYTSLGLFLPTVIALAIIPTLIRVTIVLTDSIKIKQYFDVLDRSDAYGFGCMDTYSQVKGSAIAFFAIVMLILALLGCKYFFRNIEKRNLIYIGASVVYVVMTLASALGSEHSDIVYFGLFDRAEGLVTLSCYFVMFLYTMHAFKKTQNFTFVVLALMVCTSVNFVIGLFQYFGNELFNYEWFRNIVVDSEFKDILGVNSAITTESRRLSGALYHYNYVGSFTGMIIPLFTTLAFTSKKIVTKIVMAVFALISVFMLVASDARSGFVAAAAAAVIGVIVFARVLIRHWKAAIAVIVVAAAGLFFITDNNIFERLPEMFTEAVSLFTPAEETDILSTLPVREITNNDDGTVSFTTQTDVLTVRYDSENVEYIFTDSEGNVLPVEEKENVTTIVDEDFSGINFMLNTSDESLKDRDYITMWFDGAPTSDLCFGLFNEDELHLICSSTSVKITAINAESIGFEGKEKLGSSRGYIWSRTIPLLGECLITGYGPDTFAFVFPQNDFLAKFYSYSTFHMTIDKPHNLYLQIFVSSGLIALIAFLVICVFYLVDCFRLYALKKKYRMEQYFGISVMLAIVGYLTAGIFNDSVVSVAPVFWILLGTGVALNTINRRMDAEEKSRQQSKS